MMPWLKGAGAVAAGLVCGGMVVMGLTFAAAEVFFAGDMSAPPTNPYLALNITYSFAAAVVAGWVAARLAPRRPLTHALAVAMCMILLSMGGSGAEAGATPGVPGWYGTVLLVLMPVGALAGGWLRVRGVTAAE